MPLPLAACALALLLAHTSPPASPPSTPARTGGHGADRAPIDPASLPGPEHERLMKLAGHYAFTTTMVVGDTKQPIATGEAVITQTLGGRFLDFEEAGAAVGTPFEARKLIGFNTHSRAYESVWVYTSSTAMLTLKGASDDGGGTITLTGAVDADPPMTITVTLTELSPTSFALTMRPLGDPEADAVPGFLESIYTRKP